MIKLDFATDLIGEPISRNLALGKLITVFNVKLSDKTMNLNTGNKFEYRDESFEIMNREPVQSAVNYFKFNCVRNQRELPIAE